MARSGRQRQTGAGGASKGHPGFIPQAARAPVLVASSSTRVRRFVLRFAIILTAFYFCYLLLRGTEIFHAYLRFVAKASMIALQASGHSVALIDRVIVSKSVSIRIGSGCEAFEAIVPFVAAPAC